MHSLPLSVITTLIYGILAIIGGAIGYRQAGSQVSLFSGFISGLLLLIGAYFLWGGATIGPLLSAIVSLVLIVVFALRWIKSRKLMPAALMIVVGVINLASLWMSSTAV